MKKILWLRFSGFSILPHANETSRFVNDVVYNISDGEITYLIPQVLVRSKRNKKKKREANKNKEEQKTNSYNIFWKCNRYSTTVKSKTNCVFRSAHNRNGELFNLSDTKSCSKTKVREKENRCIDSLAASRKPHVLVSRVQGITMHLRRTDEPSYEGQALICLLSTGKT